jgi:hypothetical protein
MRLTTDEEINKALLELWREDDPEAGRNYGHRVAEVRRALGRVTDLAEAAHSALTLCDWPKLRRALRDLHKPIYRGRGNISIDDLLMDVDDIAEAVAKYLRKK